MKKKKKEQSEIEQHRNMDTVTLKIAEDTHTHTCVWRDVKWDTVTQHRDPQHRVRDSDKDTRAQRDVFSLTHTRAHKTENNKKKRDKLDTDILEDRGKHIHRDAQLHAEASVWRHTERDTCKWRDLRSETKTERVQERGPSRNLDRVGRERKTSLQSCQKKQGSMSVPRDQVIILSHFNHHDNSTK